MTTYLRIKRIDVLFDLVVMMVLVGRVGLSSGLSTSMFGKNPFALISCISLKNGSYKMVNYSFARTTAFLTTFILLLINSSPVPAFCPESEPHTPSAKSVILFLLRASAYS
ncbi:unnamed protein product [Haemonchus placei]|uniref:7TM_GPCR_Srx domain-containing protein n=1 Tax=Haemonchus placei TaxID=6290 RepID=A0A0N4X309_HAEPC|nr:unnamed protein product [Haemonchus placei]